MIDIHAHIIFGVDDGPDTETTSKELLQNSYEQGVRTIVATSHRRKRIFDTPEETVVQNFKVVKELAQDIAADFVLLYGSEIYYTENIDEKISTGDLPTLGGTNFVLVEFGTHAPYKVIHAGLSNILCSGFTPVLAHIERYKAFDGEDQKVREVMDMGCYTQINSSSVLKAKFYDLDKSCKRRAQFFLDHGLVDLVASDMHDLVERPSYMEKAYQLIEKKYGSSCAQNLFFENQRLILEK